MSTPVHPQAAELLGQAINDHFGESVTGGKLKTDYLEEVSDFGGSVARRSFVQFQRNGMVVTIEAQVSIDVIRPEKGPVDHIPEA